MAMSANPRHFMGASPQTPGVFRIGPMGAGAGRIGPRRQGGPAAAVLRHEAPLAKSAAPVALQQSRILRMTPQGWHARRAKQAPPDLTIMIRACGPPGPPPEPNKSVTDVVGQFVTHVPVRAPTPCFSVNRVSPFTVTF